MIVGIGWCGVSAWRVACGRLLREGTFAIGGKGSRGMLIVVSIEEGLLPGAKFTP